MIIDKDSHAPNEDVGEKFPFLAQNAFAFLQHMGYSAVDSSPSFLLLRKGGVEVDVYHGRRSYEVGAGVAAHGTHYSISEVVRAVDHSAAEQYKVRSGRTLVDVTNALEELSCLLRTYGTAALNGDSDFFSLLAQDRVRWAENFELDVMARQLRPKAEDAFRRGDYVVAADLYGRIRDRLSPMEEKKLSIARVRTKDTK